MLQFMLQDRSLLQYGFLQSGAGSMSVQHRLSGEETVVVLNAGIESGASHQQLGI